MTSERHTPLVQSLRQRALLLGGLLLLICGLFLLALRGSQSAGRSVQVPGVALLNFPQDFVQYARVDRLDAMVRDLFISAEALAAARAGRPMPYGSTIAIVAYQAQRGADGVPLRDEQGHLVRGESPGIVHVAQKRGDWQAQDFPGGTVPLFDEWNFGSFALNGERHDEDLLACINCHNTTGREDPLWSNTLLRRFISSGEVQYFYCELSGRSPC